ncbi:TPA: glycosyl hydrolase family 28-related protein [Klebsiella pneumoniae]
MVDEYNTGNPVPSSAMPDAWDNNATIDAFVSSQDLKVKTRTGIERDTMSGMQKKFDDQLTQQRVDFDVQHLSQSDTFNISQSEREATFSRQLSEQEGVFESSQADKENRFASFLDSSGYVFLGDYQNGPFQFSARNQYIRYNNQYYRLNAATDVGFTTTGTDATSFANDVTHFVLMDGDTLRQNLGSNDLPGLALVALPKSGNLLNAVPEFYVDAFGADPTGATSSTAAVNAALAAINSRTDSLLDSGTNPKYYELVFGAGRYVVGDILLKSGVTYRGQGAYATCLIPEAGAEWVFKTVGTKDYTTYRSPYRAFRACVKDMHIGCGLQNMYSDVSIPAGVGGIYVAHASYVSVENVYMRYMDGPGLWVESMWDSDVNNLRIMHVGGVGSYKSTGNVLDANWAIYIGPGDDARDGSNANRFNNIHIETCPAMICVDKRSRHNFFNGGKLENGYYANADDYVSNIIRGVNGLLFTNMELSWSNVGHFMFEAIGTTTVNDTSTDDQWNDLDTDHSTGVVFADNVIIDDNALMGNYFSYSSKKGTMNITGGYARHIRYLFSGDNISVSDIVLHQCGSAIGFMQGNVSIDGMTVQNRRNPVAGTNHAFVVSGTGNTVRNSSFSAPYGSVSDGNSWFNMSSSAAELDLNNIYFGGKMQYGVSGASVEQQKRFKNVKLKSGASYGEIVGGGFSVDGLPTRLINNSGGAVTLMQEVAANTTAVFRGCIHGSASLTIRVENSAGAYVGAATALTDFSISTPLITGNLSNNFSAGGSGSPGDGRFYISSSGNDMSFTNRTTGTVKVYLISINAKM